MKKISKEEFINKAIEVHGDKFDYSLLKYECIIQIAEFTCKNGHTFSQLPSAHLNGNGCAKCAGNKRLTQEEFLKVVRNKHGDRFGYELAIYKSAHANIIVRCHDHGLFITTPNIHKNQLGCKRCQEISDTKKYYNSYINFINKSYEIHKGKYKYDFVEFVNTTTKVKIMCGDHIFEQTPKLHLKGNGCYICKGGIAHTKEKILEMFNDVHGDRYKYLDFEYKNITEKINIECDKHGIFSQRIDNHLSGNGCKKCVAKSSKIENEWLDSIEKSGVKLIRQHKIPGTNYYVDGFDPETNTVYEFHGDYWHGNPKVYDHNKINTKTGMTFGQLYNHTVNKENIIRNAGYIIIVMWESDYYENFRT